MFDSRETLTLRHLTTRQNVTVHHVSVQLGIPLRPAREVLAQLESRGYVRTSVRANLTGPKGEHQAWTVWHITPLGRLALAQGQRDSRARV